MNDDIEKRVLVNKDGSLSVEMRVRFRLQNDQTLLWSTQIKKSPSDSLTNDCFSLKETQPPYLPQGQSESRSDSGSCDPEAVEYVAQPLQRPLEESHCPCCYQRQDQPYDLWENPAHSKAAAMPLQTSRHTHSTVRHTHSSSSSSSCHSQRLVRRRAEPSGGGPEPGQVLQEEMCVTEEVQRRVEVERDGDTRVVCTVRRCCSRSEMTAGDGLHPHSRREEEEKSEGGGGKRSSQSHGNELMMSEGEERPFSAVSNSSHILHALQEDLDDEDLPPSVSRCCHSNDLTPTQIGRAHV